MLRVHGVEETPEALAANHLATLAQEAWPWIRNDDDSILHIIPSVKCHGQLVRDLDVVILGAFSDRATFRPFLGTGPSEDRRGAPDRIYVRSLCCIVELKEHDQHGVRFEGSKVHVTYDRGRTFKDASEQVERQVYSLRSYLQSQGVASPFITGLVWLRNVSNRDLPPRPHNIVGGNLSWDMLLNVISQLVRVTRSPDGRCMLDPIGHSDCGKIVEPLCRRLEPTALDRVRMDRISKAALDRQWLSAIGTKQIVFRGRGGTGKTVILLQLAWKAYEQGASRSLVLTYNTALVADIRRLLTLLGLPDTRAVQIRTLHSFLWSIFRALSIPEEKEDGIADFEKLKKRTLDFYAAGVLTDKDISRALAATPDELEWDYLLLDEAHDWNKDERDLLRILYRSHRFVIADGVDQYVRNQVSCDWRAGLTPDECRVIKLQTCLRMKSNLARFANLLACRLNLEGWVVRENEEATGGRVIIIDGEYFSEPRTHTAILDANYAAGNRTVDMLMCVPPTRVRTTDGGVRRSHAAEHLESLGLSVWDGAAEDVRRSYPTSVDQHRIIQYDSCRGLEGWTVINLGLDEFFEYKVNEWRLRSVSPSEPGAFENDSQAASQYASRWMMIPLTRAMDTLVITITRRPSAVREALTHVAEACPDIVEWRAQD